jgi:hypothetical protein
MKSPTPTDFFLSTYIDVWIPHVISFFIYLYALVYFVLIFLFLLSHFSRSI